MSVKLLRDLAICAARVVLLWWAIAFFAGWAIFGHPVSWWMALIAAAISVGVDAALVLLIVIMNTLVER